MRKTLLAVGVLFIYGISSGELLACGDKFLVASRGTRYQRAGQARHGASILVYMHASSTIPKAFERVSEDVTKKAGYRVTRVANANELDQALRQGGWDVLLADLADSPDVRGRVQSSGPDAPLLVPVAYGVTGTQIAQAKKEYQRVLKGPIKTYAFLAAMDDALAVETEAAQVEDGLSSCVSHGILLALLALGIAEPAHFAQAWVPPAGIGRGQRDVPDHQQHQSSTDRRLALRRIRQPQPRRAVQSRLRDHRPFLVLDRRPVPRVEVHGPGAKLLRAGGRRLFLLAARLAGFRRDGPLQRGQRCVRVHAVDILRRARRTTTTTSVRPCSGAT